MQVRGSVLKLELSIDTLPDLTRESLLTRTARTRYGRLTQKQQHRYWLWHIGRQYLTYAAVS